ncbi:PH domain-containing protein [uncultured Methanoregula sp.]|uniref:PH domain-containing protein n=1 Tax=uncultured Methanoregula sp. TaxID=1005933 RepID=UPI002AAC1761|nr:PH domain-containing protein [uncultured Methanoregula sp.]
MPDSSVTPECSLSGESPAGKGSDCGDSVSHVDPGPATPPETASATEGPVSPDNNEDLVLLTTHPDPRSFIYKYVLACFPIVLVILCIFIRSLLGGVTQALIPGIPGSFSMVVPTVTSFANLAVYLVAPVGIFVIVAGIGWTLRFTELWTSTLITLLLSIVVGMLIMSGTGIPLISERYVSGVLHWIAYLVQPFCLLSAVMILGWTEKFRRSITYTLLKENLVIRGGVWKHQEHLIPHHQIARVVLEQDFFGRMFNYGTVIPQSISRWGAETSLRGVGSSGQKDNIGAMIGFAKGREEASRYPLDCFFGIPDPRIAQELMKQLMLRPASREEEQVMYLKQIRDKM